MKYNTYKLYVPRSVMMWVKLSLQVYFMVTAANVAPLKSGDFDDSFEDSDTTSLVPEQVTQYIATKGVDAFPKQTKNRPLTMVVEK